jgi:hypothetical protein
MTLTLASPLDADAAEAMANVTGATVAVKIVVFIVLILPLVVSAGTDSREAAGDVVGCRRQTGQRGRNAVRDDSVADFTRSDRRIVPKGLNVLHCVSSKTAKSFELSYRTFVGQGVVCAFDSPGLNGLAMRLVFI